MKTFNETNFDNNHCGAERDWRGTGAGCNAIITESFTITNFIVDARYGRS